MKTRYDELMAKVPMNRLGVPDDRRSGGMDLLGSRHAFVTGASHLIDGGFFAAWIVWRLRPAQREAGKDDQRLMRVEIREG